MRCDRARPRLTAVSVLLVFIAPLFARADATPTLVESSVLGGWTTVTTSVAARYTAILAPGSTVSVTDREGRTLPGRVTLHLNTIILNLEAPMRVVDGPFEARFTVKGFSQAASAPPTVSTLPFRIDIEPPRRPDIEADALFIPDPTDRIPGGRALMRPTPNDPVVLTGRFSESGVKSAYEWSGVAVVEARFFDRSGVERTTLRRSASLPCDPNCSYDGTYRIDTSHLPIGMWTVRVNAFDLATNRSADSDPLTFVRAS